MKIIGTGLSGMIGSRITSLLSHDFEFENLSLETGIDITDKKTVDRLFDASKAPWVFHFAAFTDVDGSEKDKEKGEESIAWKVNVTSTKYITDAARRNGKHVLYISTDFVFDGSKKYYSEMDSPNPQGWYAKTKFEGEKLVGDLGKNALICRIANPYRANPQPKPDFVHRILSRLQTGGEIQAPDDQIFIPTFIDDIALALQKLVLSNASGIYHCVGSQAISPYKAAIIIADTYGLSKGLISKTTFQSFFSGRAHRPFQANLKNDKITKFGVSMKSFVEGLKIVLRQERT